MTLAKAQLVIVEAAQRNQTLEAALQEVDRLLADLVSALEQGDLEMIEAISAQLKGVFGRL